MTTEPNRRRSANDAETPRMPKMSGVPVREDDIEPMHGLHWVANLFRAMAGLLFLLMLAQIAFGLMSVVPISYGVLIAEGIRLLIFAGLLWGFGALADLFVRSHDDLRATRVLLARIAYRLREDRTDAPVPPAVPAPDRQGRDDAGYRH